MDELLIIGNFFVISKNGIELPLNVCESINSARAEANKLYELHKTEMLILQIVDNVSSKEVPFARLEVTAEINYDFDDELRFNLFL